MSDTGTDARQREGTTHTESVGPMVALTVLALAILAFFIVDRLGVVATRGALMQFGIIGCGGVGVLALLNQGQLRVQLCVTTLLALVIAVPINRLADLTRPTLVIFFVVTGLLTVVGCHRRSHASIEGRILAGTYIGMLIIATVLSASTSGIIKLGLSAIPAAGAFMLAARLDFAARRQVCVAIVVLACAEALLAIAEPFAFAKPLYPAAADVTTDAAASATPDNTLLPWFDRSQGTLGHALALGFFLMVSLGLLLRVVRPPLWAKWTIIALLVAGIVFASSRNSLLIGFVLVLLFPPRRLTAVRVIWGALLGGIVLFAAVLAEKIPVAFFNEFIDSGSYTHRVAVVQAMGGLLTEQSLRDAVLGNGFGALPSLYARGLLQTDGLNVVDNEFVASLAVGGLIAMVALVALLIRPLFEKDFFWRAAIVVIVANCFIFDWFSWPSSAGLAFFVLGSAYCFRTDNSSMTVVLPGAVPRPKAVGTFGSFLGLVRRSGLIVVGAVLIGAVLAFARVQLTPTTNSSSMQFFVSSVPQGTTTPLQSDIYTQRRMNSYLRVLQSDELVDRVRVSSGFDLTTGQVRSAISGSIDASSVLLRVTVSTHDPGITAALAEAVSREFGPMVAELERAGSDSGTEVRLNLVNIPAADPAVPADSPLLNAAFGALVGLALGLGIATARAHMDRRLRSTRSVEEAAGRPVLATLTSRPARHGKLDADGVARADEFTRLRTNLGYFAAGEDLRVVVVSAPSHDPNKSSIARDLARAYSDAQVQVLLVDADMRRRVLTTASGLSACSGLSDVLTGRVSLDDAMQRQLGRSFVVLTAGGPVPNPAELLASSSMAELVRKARASFDIVIVDAPPVLPVADAQICATWADGVLLTVRFGRTSSSELRRAVQSLLTVDTRRVGCVLAGARPSAISTGPHDEDTSIPDIVRTPKLAPE